MGIMMFKFITLTVKQGNVLNYAWMVLKRKICPAIIYARVRVGYPSRHLNLLVPSTTRVSTYSVHHKKLIIDISNM